MAIGPYKIPSTDDKSKRVSLVTRGKKRIGIGESLVPERDERLSQLRSTDPKYGILLRRAYERGTLDEKKKREYQIGVEEGIFEPAEGMEEIYGIAARRREEMRVKDSGLSSFEEDTLLGPSTGKGSDRAMTGFREMQNSSLFGLGDRANAAALDIDKNDGSVLQPTREAARLMRDRGVEDPELKATRLSRGRARERNPISALGGEFAGYLIPGTAGMKATSSATRAAGRATGIERALIGSTPTGVTRIGRTARYVKDVLPRAAAGGAVDGAIYGQTVSRSNEEARTGEDIDLFSDKANSLMLRDAGYGAVFGAILSPIARGVRAGTTYASDVLNQVPKDMRAGGRTGIDALEYRLTPKDRKKEVVFDNMRRMGMGQEDAQYVMRAVEEGRMDDADKVLRNSYNAALIMIEKRLRAENIPIERLENKMRELAYAGDSVDEFFFEIAALAGSGKTQSLANALATVGGEAKTIAVENFDDRSLDAFDRVKSTLNSAFGIDGSEYYPSWDAMKERGKKAVNAAYAEAEKTGAITDDGWAALVTESGGMSIIRQPSVREAIDASIGLANDASQYGAARQLEKLSKALDDLQNARKALDEAVESNDQGVIDAAGDSFAKAQEALLRAKPTVSAFKYIDQHMTWMRNQANMPTSNRNPAGVASSQDTLRRVTDPDTGLQTPRDVNAKYATADEAFEEGRKMFSQGTDVETLLSMFERKIARYDGSDPEILPALLQGFVRGAEDAISTAGGIGTALRRIYGSPRSRQKLEAMLDEARSLASKQAKTPNEARAIKSKMTKALRQLLGGKKQVKKRSETGTGTYKDNVVVPGRLQREISMQDSKNQTIRGSQTASRFQAIREQDEFADGLDEAIDTASRGVGPFLMRYGRAAVRRVAQSGIYNPDVNRELGNIMFRGGREHLEQTINNIKRVRSARMGKRDLDLLARPQRSKLMSGSSAAALNSSGQNMTAGAKTRRALANQKGSASLEVTGSLAGGAIGWQGAQDIDNDGRISYWERAVFAVGGAIFGKAVATPRGRSSKFNMYMGINSEKADLAAHDMAVDMSRAGASADEIRAQTGWFKGADGKWRYEIDDSNSMIADEAIQMVTEIRQRMAVLAPALEDVRNALETLLLQGDISVNDFNSRMDKAYKALGFEDLKQQEIDILNRASTISSHSTLLGSVISHPTLFEAYPKLKDLRIVMQDLPPGTSGAMARDMISGERVLIVAKGLEPKKKRSVILHEVMHWIQTEEGFAPGGNVQDARFQKKAEAVKLFRIKTLREEARMIMKLDPSYDRVAAMDLAAKNMSNAPDGADFPLWIRREALDELGTTDEYIDKMIALYRVKDASNGKGMSFTVDTPVTIYRRLMGEVEARDVQERMDFDEATRRETSPEETQQTEFDYDVQVNSDQYKDGIYYAASEKGNGAPELPQETVVWNGGRVARSGEDVLQPSSTVLSPLAGSPKEVTIPGVGKVPVTPHAPAREARDRYMAKTGREYTPIKTYKKVDRERATRIADAFEKMVHEPTNPKVFAAYNKMIEETIDQFRFIEETGLKIEFIEDGMPDPYAASPRLAIEDVKNNNHLWVYPTDSGYGQGAITAEEIAQNPLLRETDIEISGRRARANDIFRVVHDYFGHIAEGNGFRADGEENAWRLHASMYSPEAVGAMTSETRGQNSWLNFGPHGEANQTAKSIDTVYAEQKIGLLPDWTYTEGLADDVPGDLPMMSIESTAKFETPGSPEWEAAKAKGLDMSTEARNRRAIEQGYSEQVFYHANTGGIKGDGFDNSKLPLGDPDAPFVAHWFIFEPNEFAAYPVTGNTITPVRLKLTNPAPHEVINELKKTFRNEDLRAELVRRGYTHVVWQGRSKVDWDAFDRDGRVVYYQGRGAKRTLVKDVENSTDTEEYIDIYGGANAQNHITGIGSRAEFEEMFPEVETIAVFDPSAIRSVHAAFDPDAVGRNILMGGIALPGFKQIDNVITNWGSKVAEKTRARLAKVDDPRHYGPQMKGYGIPKGTDFVYDRPLYEQIERPRQAAADIAESASLRGGQESGERAVEYVANTHMRRVQAREMAKDRASAIADQGAAGQELADALRDLEGFFGENGAHRAFKTQKAKRAEHVRLMERVRIAQEAADTAMGARVPKEPEMPPQREQMLLQEMNRVERPAGYRSSDMMRDMSVYDSNGMRVNPDPEFQLNEGIGVKPNARSRPRGRRRAAIDNRATEMILEPGMAGEARRAAEEAGDGFRVSRRVGRAVGYGAVGTVALAYGAHMKVVEQELKTWEKELEKSADERMPMDTFDRPTTKPSGQGEWNRIPYNDRIRIQNTLNTVNTGQISVDGSYGDQTRAAIEEFQTNSGLPVTGVMDNATLKAVNLIAAKNAWQWDQQEKKRRVGRSASTQLQSAN